MPPRPGLADLHPANFAMVMATGIVSLGCHQLDMPLLGRALFAVNAVAYVVIWALTLVRVVRHGGRVAADFAHHGRAVGFFTTVAATSVFGSQCLLIGEAPGAAKALWVLAIVLWTGITYTVLTVLTVKPKKPPIDEGLNGGWLLFVVAAQSVAVLGVQLAPRFGASEHAILFFSLATWLVGVMLYVWIIALIFYRYTFFPMSPSDLAPPYWINMGAAAITTLAGSLLCAASSGGDPILAGLGPFLRGMTILFWATATWWIPMLVLLGLWRHVWRRYPVRYDPLYWGAVFPLGMYTVATLRLTQVLDAPFLRTIADAGIYVALAAWGATFLLAVTRRSFPALMRT